MNLTSYKPPRAFLDTTILCGALRTDGLNRQLLRLARDTTYFTPVISRVCLFEFYHVTINKGLHNVFYSASEINDFIEFLIYPILEKHQIEAAKSTVGRYSIETILRENWPIGEVLTYLSNCSLQEAQKILQQTEMKEPLYKFDQNDFHVWITAIKENCDLIVTSNKDKFPSKIGKITRVHPVQFFNSLNIG